MLPCKPSYWIPSPSIVIPAPAANFSFCCHMCTSGQSSLLWIRSATLPLHKCSQLATNTTHTPSWLWPLPPFWLPLLSMYLWITPPAEQLQTAGLGSCCHMHAYSQPPLLSPACWTPTFIASPSPCLPKDTHYWVWSYCWGPHQPS